MSDSEDELSFEEGGEESESGSDEESDDDSSEGDSGSDSELSPNESSGVQNDVVSDEDLHRESCPICLNRFVGQELGSPESCNHSFCFECIFEWSRNINTCPIDRTEFQHVLLKTPGGKIVKKIKVKVAPKEPEGALEEDVTLCEVCHRGDREDRLLLCDSCDLAYHCECLDPPLFYIPTGEFFCPPCSNVLHDGATAGPSHSRATRRSIPRTKASEVVRSRVQDLRSGIPPFRRTASTSRSTTSRAPKKRRPRRRGKVIRKFVKLARTKKNLMDAKKGKCAVQGSTVLVTYKRKYRRRKKRRSTKTKVSQRSRHSSKVVVPPSTKKRIANQLGIHKPPEGLSMPQVKSSNSRTFSKAGKLPSHSLFGMRDQLMDFDEDFSELASSSSSNLPSTSRQEPVASSSVSHSPLDILDSIMAGQEMLHSKSDNIVIRTDGSLALKNKLPQKKNSSDTKTNSSRTPMHVALIKNNKSLPSDLKNTSKSKFTSSASNGSVNKIPKPPPCTKKMPTAKSKDQSSERNVNISSRFKNHKIDGNQLDRLKKKQPELRDSSSEGESINSYLETLKSKNVNKRKIHSKQVDGESNQRKVEFQVKQEPGNANNETCISDAYANNYPILSSAIKKEIMSDDDTNIDTWENSSMQKDISIEIKSEPCDSYVRQEKLNAPKSSPLNDEEDNIEGDGDCDFSQSLIDSSERTYSFNESSLQICNTSKTANECNESQVNKTKSHLYIKKEISSGDEKSRSKPQEVEFLYELKRFKKHRKSRTNNNHFVNESFNIAKVSSIKKEKLSDDELLNTTENLVLAQNKNVGCGNPNLIESKSQQIKIKQEILTSDDESTQIPETQILPLSKMNKSSLFSEDPGTCSRSLNNCLIKSEYDSLDTEDELPATQMLPIKESFTSKSKRDINPSALKLADQKDKMFTSKPSLSKAKFNCSTDSGLPSTQSYQCTDDLPRNSKKVSMSNHKRSGNSDIDSDTNSLRHKTSTSKDTYVKPQLVISDCIRVSNGSSPSSGFHTDIVTTGTCSNKTYSQDDDDILPPTQAFFGSTNLKKVCTDNVLTQCSTDCDDEALLPDTQRNLHHIRTKNARKHNDYDELPPTQVDNDTTKDKHSIYSSEEDSELPPTQTIDVFTKPVSKISNHVNSSSFSSVHTKKLSLTQPTDTLTKLNHKISRCDNYDSSASDDNDLPPTQATNAFLKPRGKSSNQGSYNRPTFEDEIDLPPTQAIDVYTESNSKNSKHGNCNTFPSARTNDLFPPLRADIFTKQNHKILQSDNSSSSEDNDLPPTQANNTFFKPKDKASNQISAFEDENDLPPTQAIDIFIKPKCSTFDDESSLPPTQAIDVCIKPKNKTLKRDSNSFTPEDGNDLPPTQDIATFIKPKLRTSKQSNCNSFASDDDDLPPTQANGRFLKPKHQVSNHSGYDCSTFDDESSLPPTQAIDVFTKPNSKISKQGNDSSFSSEHAKNFMSAQQTDTITKLSNNILQCYNYDSTSDDNDLPPTQATGAFLKPKDNISNKDSHHCSPFDYESDLPPTQAIDAFIEPNSETLKYSDYNAFTSRNENGLPPTQDIGTFIRPKLKTSRQGNCKSFTPEDDNELPPTQAVATPDKLKPVSTTKDWVNSSKNDDDPLNKNGVDSSAKPKQALENSKKTFCYSENENELPATQRLDDSEDDIDDTELPATQCISGSEFNSNISSNEAVMPSEEQKPSKVDSHATEDINQALNENVSEIDMSEILSNISHAVNIVTSSCAKTDKVFDCDKTEEVVTSGDGDRQADPSAIQKPRETEKENLMRNNAPEMFNQDESDEVDSENLTIEQIRQKIATSVKKNSPKQLGVHKHLPQVITSVVPKKQLVLKPSKQKTFSFLDVEKLESSNSKDSKITTDHFSNSSCSSETKLETSHERGPINFKNCLERNQPRSKPVSNESNINTIDTTDSNSSLQDFNGAEIRKSWKSNVNNCQDSFSEIDTELPPTQSLEEPELASPFLDDELPATQAIENCGLFNEKNDKHSQLINNKKHSSETSIDIFIKHPNKHLHENESVTQINKYPTATNRRNEHDKSELKNKDLEESTLKVTKNESDSNISKLKQSLYSKNNSSKREKQHFSEKCMDDIDDLPATQVMETDFARPQNSHQRNVLTKTNNSHDRHLKQVWEKLPPNTLIKKQHVSCIKNYLKDSENEDPSANNFDDLPATQMMENDFAHKQNSHQRIEAIKSINSGNRYRKQSCEKPPPAATNTKQHSSCSKNEFNESEIEDLSANDTDDLPATQMMEKDFAHKQNSHQRIEAIKSINSGNKYRKQSCEKLPPAVTNTKQHASCSKNEFNESEIEDLSANDTDDLPATQMMENDFAHKQNSHQRIEAIKSINSENKYRKQSCEKPPPAATKAKQHASCSKNEFNESEIEDLSANDTDDLPATQMMENDFAHKQNSHQRIEAIKSINSMNKYRKQSREKPPPAATNTKQHACSKNEFNESEIEDLSANNTDDLPATQMMENEVAHKQNSHQKLNYTNSNNYDNKYKGLREKMLLAALNRKQQAVSDKNELYESGKNDHSLNDTDDLPATQKIEDISCKNQNKFGIKKKNNQTAYIENYLKSSDTQKTCRKNVNLPSSNIFHQKSDKTKNNFKQSNSYDNIQQKRGASLYASDRKGSTKSRNKSREYDDELPATQEIENGKYINKQDHNGSKKLRKYMLINANLKKLPIKFSEQKSKLKRISIEISNNKFCISQNSENSYSASLHCDNIVDNIVKDQCFPKKRKHLPDLLGDSYGQLKDVTKRTKTSAMDTFKPVSVKKEISSPKNSSCSSETEGSGMNEYLASKERDALPEIKKDPDSFKNVYIKHEKLECNAENDKSLSNHRGTENLDFPMNNNLLKLNIKIKEEPLSDDECSSANLKSQIKTPNLDSHLLKTSCPKNALQNQDSSESTSCKTQLHCKTAGDESKSENSTYPKLEKNSSKFEGKKHKNLVCDKSSLKCKKDLKYSSDNNINFQNKEKKVLKNKTDVSLLVDLTIKSSIEKKKDKKKSAVKDISNNIVNKECAKENLDNAKKTVIEERHSKEIKTQDTKKHQISTLSEVVETGPKTKKQKLMHYIEIKKSEKSPDNCAEMRKVDKKLDLKEEIAEEIKLVLKPFYVSGLITKENYKDIMRKAVPKVFLNCNNSVHPEKIKKLVLNYVSLLSS